MAAGTEAEDFDRQLRSSRSLPRTMALPAEPPAGLYIGGETAATSQSSLSKAMTDFSLISCICSAIL